MHGSIIIFQWATAFWVNNSLSAKKNNTKFAVKAALGSSLDSIDFSENSPMRELIFERIQVLLSSSWEYLAIYIWPISSDRAFEYTSSRLRSLLSKFLCRMKNENNPATKLSRTHNPEWNNHQRKEYTNPIFSIIDRVFGITNLISFTRDLFVDSKEQYTGNYKKVQSICRMVNIEDYKVAGRYEAL